MDQPSPYPYQAAAWPAGPPMGRVDDPTSKRGAIALGLAVAALLLSLFFSWLSAKGYGDLMRAQGTLEIDTANLPSSQEGHLLVAGFGIMGQLLPTGLGVAAFIIAIGALRLPSQKAKATGGLVLALLAPLISLTFFVVLLVRVMSEIGF